MDVQPTFNSLLEFFEYFSSKETCIKYFIKLRWDEKIICPHCNHSKIYILNTGGFKCANNKCYKKFNAFTNTALANSKIDIKLWFAAIYLLTTSTYGISSHALARKLNIRQHTAWYMLQRIREFLKEKIAEPLSGIIQLDEAVVGGRNQFRHRDKKVPWVRGQAAKDKTWVFGMVKDDVCHVRLFVIPDRTAKSLCNLVKEHITPLSVIVTDEYQGYQSLNRNYFHVVTKVKGSFRYKTEDGYHTNRIEGLWTHLKRAYKGVYHHMSRKHLQRYCNEVSFRYMFRNGDDCATFKKALGGVSGSRLKYKDLVGYESKRKSTKTKSITT
jgi:transposase-like protein/IS1 family transposase